MPRRKMSPTDQGCVSPDETALHLVERVIAALP
jgi:hypothetical protein